MLQQDILTKDQKMEGIIKDIEQLYKLVSRLKRMRRKLIYNLFLSENELGKQIKKDNWNYYYVPGKYLNLWVEQQSYVKLYFYIADLDAYKVIDTAKIIICDIFCSKETQELHILKEILFNNGFHQHASYHKWVRKFQAAEKICSESVLICKHRERGFFRLLKQSFDPYSDFIPSENIESEFFNSKICCSAISKQTCKLIGGIVITKQGNIQTEEFIFVDPQYCRQGVAGLLHSYWYNTIAGQCTQFVAWIRDDNKASIRLHLKYGYKMQQAFKITLKKENG